MAEPEERKMRDAQVMRVPPVALPGLKMNSNPTRSGA
jgi:hypothetical protein